MADQLFSNKERIRNAIRDAVIQNRPNGNFQWQKIANDLAAVGIQTDGRKIREMWINYLDPELNLEPFTADEMQTLKNLYFEAKGQGRSRLLESGKYQLPLKDGNPMSWENILPRRSPNVVKNAYYSQQKYWLQGQAQEPELLPANISPSVVRDDAPNKNNLEFHEVDGLFRELMDPDPRITPNPEGPFAFSLTTKYDTPPGAAFGSFDERRGGKSARKFARKSSRKPSRKSSRKAKKSSRKYRKVTRK
jgi:hypothetical protein